VRQTIKAIPVLLIMTVLLAGCMPPQPPRTEQDLVEMKRRLAANEQALVALRKEMGGQGSGALENVTRNQADLKADLDAFRADLLAQQGQFDELNAAVKNQQNRLQQLRDELDFKIKAIEERLAKLEATSAVRPQAPSVNVSPESLYQQGLDAVRSGSDFAHGRQLLSDFLAKYPQHPLAINARYWIGEAWYGEKEYKNAILQFQDVIQEYGDHPKVAAALLKQALSFQALGDKDNGRVILEKLVGSFPLSDEAKKAKTMLSQ